MPRRQIDLRGLTAGTAYPLPSVAPTGIARIYYDLAAAKVKLSLSGGAATTLNAEVASGSATWNPGDLATGAQELTTVTVTGATLGQFALVSFSLDLQGLQLTGYVSAADTVTALLQNNTGGNINLASGTLRARVL